MPPMTEITHATSASEVPSHRWLALLLLVVAMTGGYVMLYTLSPLQGLLQSLKGWSAEDYSLYSAAEPFLNVFCGLLFVGGLVLDRYGLFRSVAGACSAMLIGAGINWYALVSESLAGSTLFGMPSSVAVAAVGFMVFGVGVELTGVAASRTTVRWFAGRELSLAMGIQLACSRVAVALGLWLSPKVAMWGTASVGRPVALALALILAGSPAWMALCRLERNLRKPGDAETASAGGGWNLRPLLTNRLFWIITSIIVLYYASVVPFYRYAALMLTQTVGLSTDDAATLLSVLPLAGALFTPVICWMVDKKGLALHWLACGSVLVAGAYTLLTIYAGGAERSSSVWVAAVTMTVLAIGSAIASASVWPLVPRIIRTADLGKGYALIYWLQNIGFMVMPLIAGALMSADRDHYNYAAMTAAFTATAIICSGVILWLSVSNRNKDLGLNRPEKK